MKDGLIVLPTYNEVENIVLMLDAIFSLSREVHVLVVDDSSPDGTSISVKEIQQTDNKLHLITRNKKMGLGSAYCEGFSWAIKNNFDYVIQMDADLSHNPSDILNLLDEIKHSDLVIGSRYKTGVNVVNWPLSRLFLSYMANVYARIFTGLKIHDLTSGFKCIKIEVLKSIDLNKINSEGYSFQIEINFLCSNKNFKISEIPIIFFDRTVGQSKMSKKIILEAILKVPMFKLKNILRIK